MNVAYSAAPVASFLKTLRGARRGRRPSWLEGSSSEEEDGADRKAPPALEERDRDAWFLESLSEAVEPERSQPDALLFRRRFRALRDELVSELFAVFNRKLFRDRVSGPIPTEDKLVEKVCRERDVAGVVRLKDS